MKILNYAIPEIEHSNIIVNEGKPLAVLWVKNQFVIQYLAEDTYLDKTKYVLQVEGIKPNVDIDVSLNFDYSKNSMPEYRYLNSTNNDGQTLAWYWKIDK